MKTFSKKKIPLFDSEAQWMINKKKKKQLLYNIQTCIDTESQLFLSVYASQNATDYYEFPPTLEKTIENSPQKSQVVLADA